MNSSARNTDGGTIDRKVAINSAITATRVVISAIASILTTRFAISALGIESFGVYVTLAAIPIGLSFLTAALLMTTQRSLTVAADENERSQLFDAFLGMHLAVAVVLAIVCETAAVFALGELRIPAEQLASAQIAIQFAILGSVVGALLVPFEAILLAHERFTTLAVFDIARALLLLTGTYWLTSFHGDRLIAYAMLITLTTIAANLGLSLFCAVKHPESRPGLSRLYHPAIFKEQFQLFSWTTIGSFTAVVRNQGFILLINLLFGPSGSAAFAIGNQLVSAIRQLVTTVTRVLTPRIYKVSADDRQGMIRLSFESAKFATVGAIILGIPLMAEMEFVLSMWLTDVPLQAVQVSLLLMLAFALDQTSSAVGVAHLATGRIARFYLVCGLTGMSSLPIGYVCGVMTDSQYWVLSALVTTTLVVTVQRVWLLDSHISQPLPQWITTTIVPVLKVLVPVTATAAAVILLLEDSLLRLSIVIICCTVIGLVLTYTRVFTVHERAELRHLLRIGGVQQ